MIKRIRWKIVKSVNMKRCLVLDVLVLMMMKSWSSIRNGDHSLLVNHSICLMFMMRGRQKIDGVEGRYRG